MTGSDSEVRMEQRALESVTVILPKPSKCVPFYLKMKFQVLKDPDMSWAPLFYIIPSHFSPSSHSTRHSDLSAAHRTYHASSPLSISAFTVLSSFSCCHSSLCSHTPIKERWSLNTLSEMITTPSLAPLCITFLINSNKLLHNVLSNNRHESGGQKFEVVFLD